MFRSATPTSSRATSAGRRSAAASGETYGWDDGSTYVQAAALLRGHGAASPAPIADIAGARVLAMLGDSITTDHISPAGSIARKGPAGAST